MKTIYLVDYYDADGHRRRKTFQTAIEAELFERKARSNVLVRRAAKIYNAGSGLDPELPAIEPIDALRADAMTRDQISAELSDRRREAVRKARRERNQ